jgi:hypothetical protein
VWEWNARRRRRKKKRTEEGKQRWEKNEARVFGEKIEKEKER